MAERKTFVGFWTNAATAQRLKTDAKDNGRSVSQHLHTLVVERLDRKTKRSKDVEAAK